ncbi:hypothetical protein QYE76_012341 [Lolium multiflorum]|uniref:Retrotransposon gag domain-containing protein n=1 Tax=Lolium multiflorum TaxID=4521 RepID=A0AAD8X6K2_LOLMU|nr:hypothetical protein QYE76_012341 [Lolium multiflorum]
MAKDTIPSSSEVAEETPVTYGDLTGELKKKYDEIKSALEADLIGSFHRTRSHGIRWKGFTPEGALDGVDLSTPSEERTRSLRQEINFMVAHSLHRHSESLVNTLERVALRVIQEIMSHQYSPSGPALGTHQGEALLHSRPPLPFALAAPEAPNSSAFVVYKIGGDPSDYQFLQDAPKEIPHGYACAYVPDCSTWAPSNQVAIAGTSGATGGTSEADPEKQTWLAKYATPTKLPSPAPAVGSEPEKQAWLVKYATPTNLQGSAPAAITADQICTILKDQFGMMPKRKAIGYTKPYPNEYELIPLPPKYRLPDFTKFSGSDGSSSIEHVSRYLAQLGMISASDELRVRYFSQSLTGSAFGWYTSLPPNSIQTWKQLEERFHEQYHSEASEAGIADLAQVRQKRGETVSEYIQRFRTVRNRCYSVHVSEKEAVELAVVGLSSSIKDVASQADYPSLAHMVQKLSAYEQRHPDVYQDKFKRVVTMVDAGEDEVATGEQEVAVAEWTRAAGPVTCKWVKPPGPPRGFDFDVTKTEQIFDLLLAEKHIKIPEGHKVPTVQELNGKPYCKWHNTFTHTTNDCRVCDTSPTSNVDPNNVPLASLVAQEENVDVNFIKNNNFNNNAYRNNSGNNYRPYPSANGNGYGNSYGNSYNNNRSVPSGLEAMLKEFISTQTAFNKSVEEKLDKIDTIASRVDRLASDVNLLKLKVMPNNDLDNKITTTANAIQVRINENIRLMAELRARWDREENEKLAKENNVAKVWTITTTSNANSSHVAAPPTINGKIIGVGNVSTPSAKRTKLPEIAKTAETACDKTAEIFSNLGNNDPIAVAHNDLDFDDCHISEVIKFLQKLAKSPNASAINLAFTKHITNALIKAREEKLKLETSIPRKLEDGWEPIIKMKFNDFECNALCDLGASISVMPKKIYDMLDLPPLKNCYLDVNLADNVKKKPLGRIDNVHITVNNNLVPVDFVVLDIECNASCPIVLGRPFLRTVGAVIDMREGSFQGSREENDILRSRGVKALSLGMPPWFIPAYFKKTQASKLGDAQGIPFFIDNIIRFLVGAGIPGVAPHHISRPSTFNVLLGSSGSIKPWFHTEENLPCAHHTPLGVPNHNDCRVWRQQIQMAIENGRLIFNQYAMKVDTHPFPAVNMVEFAHLGGCQPDFSANISMVELGHRSEKDGDEDSCSQSKDTEGAAPCDRLRQDGKRYVTEGEVKNIRYQRPLSDHLLNKYVSRYDQRRQHGDDDERGRMARNDRRHRRHNHDEERQERHAREQDDTDRHWDCPFFRHCWDSGMSRLPTIGNCPECNQKKKEAANVSVFERLGPLPPQNRRAETPLLEDLEDSEDEGEDEEDRYHRPRWCPDGLSHSQKRRVQRLRGLEEAERLYLHTLRKARPDLAAKVQRTLDEEGLPQRKEWRPKQRKADDETSAGTNMVLVRPAKCRAPRSHDAPKVDNSKRTNVIKSEIGLVLSTDMDE